MISTLQQEVLAYLGIEDARRVTEHVCPRSILSVFGIENVEKERMEVRIWLTEVSSCD